MWPLVSHVADLHAHLTHRAWLSFLFFSISLLWAAAEIWLSCFGVFLLNLNKIVTELQKNGGGGEYGRIGLQDPNLSPRFIMNIIKAI